MWFEQNINRYNKIELGLWVYGGRSSIVGRGATTEKVPLPIPRDARTRRID